MKYIFASLTFMLTCHLSASAQVAPPPAADLLIIGHGTLSYPTHMHFIMDDIRANALVGSYQRFGTLTYPDLLEIRTQ